MRPLFVTLASLTLATSVAPKAAPDPVRSFYRDLAVEAPRSYKGVAIYPLTTKKPRPLAGVLTLDEALQQGALKVTELGNAQVNTLQLENVGKQPIFAMGGEIMQGAKQDRTFQNDLLVPRLSGPMKVAVFCTEHGRWQEKTTHFGAAQAAVPNSVRGAAKATADQSSVWNSISENQRKLKVAAPTSAAKEVYQAPKVQQDLKPYLDALGATRWQANTVGVAATFGRKIVAIDTFGDPALFAKMYPKLLRSYLVDVLGDGWQGESNVAQIRTVLHDAARTPWSSGKTDGVGQAWTTRKGELHGTALTFKEAFLHSDMFVPPPEQPPQNDRNQVQEMNPPNLNIRRNHR